MITTHSYDAGWPRDDSKGCIVSIGAYPVSGRPLPCGIREKLHAESEYDTVHPSARPTGRSFAEAAGVPYADCVRDAAPGTVFGSSGGLRGKATSPEAAALEAARNVDSLGSVSTRDLLEELRLRGDVAMTLFPTSDRGADGAVLSALAGATLKSSCNQTLEAKRGE